MHFLHTSTVRIGVLRTGACRDSPRGRGPSGRTMIAVGLGTAGADVWGGALARHPSGTGDPANDASSSSRTAASFGGIQDSYPRTERNLPPGGTPSSTGGERPCGGQAVRRWNLIRPGSVSRSPTRGKRRGMRRRLGRLYTPRARRVHGNVRARGNDRRRRGASRSPRAESATAQAARSAVEVHPSAPPHALSPHEKCLDPSPLFFILYSTG